MSSFFQFERVSDSADISLFCFHYAGGSAFSYAKWKDHINKKINVFPLIMPGRSLRYDEEKAVSIESAAEQFADLIKEHFRKKIIFTGHSMGGVVAFYTAYLLESRYDIRVEKLFITGSLPDLGSSLRSLFSSTRIMTDEEFGSMLLLFGAVDKRVLKLREFRDRFLPVIRADFALLEKYKDYPDIKISSEIQVYFGESDKLVTGKDCEKWQDHTSKMITVKKCAGDHFFINENMEVICEDINEYAVSKITPNLCGSI